MVELNKIWDSQADAWDSFAEDPINYYTKRTGFIVELILKNIKTKCSVLEGACGAGLLSLLLAQKGFDVYGYDISSKMIMNTKRRLTKEFNIDSDNFRVCHDEEIPFKSMTFKVITAMDLFPYVKNYDSYIKKISEHLEIDGYVIASCNNRCSIYNLISILRQVLKIGRVSNWKKTLLNLIRTAYWSGGYVDYRTAKQAYNAERFDRIFYQNGFIKVDELSLYAIPYFDRMPLNRNRLHKLLVKKIGWQYIGVYTRQ